MAEYYAQRAGAGLIITEGRQISEQAVGNAIGFDKVGVRISPVNAFNDISDSASMRHSTKPIRAHFTVAMNMVIAIIRS